MATNLYLAGPMRGYKEFNFPAFAHARTQLRDAGYEVFCPAEEDEAAGFCPEGLAGTSEELWALNFDLRDALQVDTSWICEHADGIAVLPGWYQSSGARAEVALGRALGIPVATVAGWIQTPSMALSGDYVGVHDAIAADAITSAPMDDVSEVIGAEIIDKGWTGPDITEVRITDPVTGGQKGTKPERYDLIPAFPLAELARLYGRGAQKYDAHNWRKGYAWSLSYAALQRHVTEFWGYGQSYDLETGCHHLASVIFHAMALMEFDSDGLGTDDRYTGEEAS